MGSDHAKKSPARGVTGLHVVSRTLGEDMFDLLIYTLEMLVWIDSPKTKKPARGSGFLLGGYIGEIS